MAKFEAGNDPADHTVAEVVEFLKSDDVTGDEYDRVVQAEREGRNRVGIMSGSGVEETAAEPIADPAGPNEAATGEYSPADRAKTVDDPQASGDAGVTAEQYPDDAPASLGPDMPQSAPEEAAHEATVADLTRAERGAKPVDYTDGEVQRFTPDEALRHAQNRATEWVTSTRSASTDDD